MRLKTIIIMEKCCSEVMEYWLNNFEATWNKMTHALNHIDQTELAEDIKRNNALTGTYVV